MDQKPSSEMTPEQIYRRGYYQKNKARETEKAREWVKSHRHKLKEYHARWRAKHPDHDKEYMRRRREADPDYGRQYYRNNRDEYRSRHQARDKEIRQKVLSLYGGHCVCCGETTPEFITLDHVDNTGGHHRKTTHYGSGSNLYRLLARIGVKQPDFQLLCHNCNAAKGLYGVCPHTRTASELLNTIPYKHLIDERRLGDSGPWNFQGIAKALV